MTGFKTASHPKRKKPGFLLDAQSNHMAGLGVVVRRAEGQESLGRAALLKDFAAEPEERLIRVGWCIKATISHPFTPFLL